MLIHAYPHDMLYIQRHMEGVLPHRRGMSHYDWTDKHIYMICCISNGTTWRGKPVWETWLVHVSLQSNKNLEHFLRHDIPQCRHTMPMSYVPHIVDVIDMTHWFCMSEHFLCHDANTLCIMTYPNADIQCQWVMSHTSLMSSTWLVGFECVYIETWLIECACLYETWLVDTTHTTHR